MTHNRHALMHLSDMADRPGRDNNFNLIRMIAALAVLCSHSFVLATGRPDNEPLVVFLGISLGRLAVVTFFITSGFLVSGSLLSRGEPTRFVVSRLARIYPALVVMIALTTFVVGPVLSSSSSRTYLSQWATYKYLLANATSVFDIEFALPGVFEHTPFRSAVNASIWTLQLELWMYGLLLVAWLATAARGHRRAFAALVLGLVATGTAYYWQRHAIAPTLVSSVVGWLTSMFFIGVAAQVFRRWIVLHWAIALLVCAVLIGSTIDDLSVFKAIYPPCLAYLVLFAAYGLPAVRWFQQADYSYGLYLYAFLVQQTLANFIPGLGVPAMTALAIPISLICAIASWRVVEKPTIASVDALTARVRGGVGRLYARRVHSDSGRADFEPSN